MDQSVAPSLDNTPAPDNVDRLRALLPRLWAAALRLTGNADKAEDLVQDTLLRYWERGPKEWNEQTPGWLFTVMQRAWIDTVRKRDAHREVSIEASDGLHGLIVAEDSDPTATLTHEDVLAFPQTLLAKLKAGGAKPYLVRFMEAIVQFGIDDKERIAEAMGFSEIGSTREYLSKLRTWCREHGLEREHWLGVLIAILWGSGQSARAAQAGDRRNPEEQAVASFFAQFLADLPSFMLRILDQDREEIRTEHRRALSASDQYPSRMADFVLLDGPFTCSEIPMAGSLSDRVRGYESRSSRQGDEHGSTMCMMYRACDSFHAMRAAEADEDPQWRQKAGSFKHEVLARLRGAWADLRREPVPGDEILLAQMDEVLVEAGRIILAKVDEVFA